MPKICVTIEYDQPDDPFWLNPDNVSVALHAYCKNTAFRVEWAGEGADPAWKEPPVYPQDGAC